MPIRARKPRRLYVPIEDVRPALEKLLTERSIRELSAELTSEGRGTSEHAWRRMIDRLRHHDYRVGVDPEVAEIILLKAGLDPPKSDGYDQRMWRVTGFYPSGLGRKTSVPGMTMRTWYYIEQSAAVRKMEKLKRAGLLVEWAESVKEVTWRVL